MAYAFRPLSTWPYSETPADRRRSRLTFKAGWQDTLDLLAYEIDWLGGSDVVIGADFREGDIRMDGMPRANAREPMHPGVEISFNSKFGRLAYSTDVCELWKHNVRSIGLGLEALRAVDRYGISQRGQQYAGFAMLSAGEDPIARGRRIVEAHQGEVHKALRATHPDTREPGYSDADFQGVMAYRGRS